MKVKTILLALSTCLLLSCNDGVREPDDASTDDDALQVGSRFLCADEAAELAGDFMAQLQSAGQNTRGGDKYGSPSVRLLNLGGLTRSEGSDTIFYAVNFEKGGYTLVAADRELENKVYAYSDTGEFELDDNPVMQIYLENAIATLPDAPRYESRSDETGSVTRSMQLPNPDEPIYGGEVEIFGVKYRVVHKNSHSVKEPLLSTLWHQNEPYNIFCPKQDGVGTKVGCVAIAIGQICGYHRQPESLDGSNFDWDSMLRYDRHETQYYTGLYDVARFLHKVGVMVNMNYGVERSGSNIEDAVVGFRRLGFTTAKITGFSTSECASSVRIGCPLYMQGFGSEGGHAWVVDGYDTFTSWVEYYRIDNGELYGSQGTGAYTYLHFNAGWYDVSYNTYYLCSGYDPGQRYDDFSVFGLSENNQIITYSK